MCSMMCKNTTLTLRKEQSEFFFCLSLDTNSLSNDSYCTKKIQFLAINDWQIQLSLLIPEFLDSRLNFTNFWWNSLLLLLSRLIPEFPNSRIS